MDSMDCVVLIVYVFPRQVFAVGDRRDFTGPPGLSLYLGPPIRESGCYAIIKNGANLQDAVVYETDQCYEVFSPGGPWRELGRLGGIPGYQTLLAKQHAHGRDMSLSYWGFISGGAYRIVFAMLVSDIVRHPRVMSKRMPCGLFVCYSLSGVGRTTIGGSPQAIGISVSLPIGRLAV